MLIKDPKINIEKKTTLNQLILCWVFFWNWFFLTGTYWISNSLQFDESFKNFIPLTVLLIPLALGLFYGIGSLICGKYLSYDLKSIFLFCATISFVDYLRSKLLTGFPWNLWAYSWSWFNEVIFSFKSDWIICI